MYDSQVFVVFINKNIKRSTQMNDIIKPEMEFRHPERSKLKYACTNVTPTKKKKKNGGQTLTHAALFTGKNVLL